MEKAETIEDMARVTLCMYVALEDQQEVVVRLKGEISMHPISILVDPRYTHS